MAEMIKWVIALSDAGAVARTEEVRQALAEAWAEGHAADWSHRQGPLSNPYKDPA